MQWYKKYNKNVKNDSKNVMASDYVESKQELLQKALKTWSSRKFVHFLPRTKKDTSKQNQFSSLRRFGFICVGKQRFGTL